MILRRINFDVESLAENARAISIVMTLAVCVLAYNTVMFGHHHDESEIFRATAVCASLWVPWSLAAAYFPSNTQLVKGYWLVTPCLLAILPTRFALSINSWEAACEAPKNLRDSDGSRVKGIIGRFSRGNKFAPKEVRRTLI